jgi:hypothetical protein
MSERSELDVIVLSSPRSGEEVTGAPDANYWWSRHATAMLHQ